MNTVFKAVILTVVVGLIAGCASSPKGPRGEGAAQTGRWTAEPVSLLLVGFDANADGAVDAQEIETGIADAWIQADADGSGVVAPLEYNAWSRIWMGTDDAAPGHLSLDRNLDQSITAEEFRRAFLATVDRYDKDADGRLTRAELLEYLSRPSRRGGGGGPGRGSPPS